LLLLFRGPTAPTLQIDLVEGVTIRATRNLEPTTSFTDYAFDLTAGEQASVTDWNNLRLRFTANNSQVLVSQAYLNTPGTLAGGDVSVSPAGVAAVFAIGVALAAGDALTAQGGVTMAAAVGDALGLGDALTVPVGVEMAAAVGQATAVGSPVDATATPAGVAMLAEVGQATAFEAVEQTLVGGGAWWWRPRRVSVDGTAYPFGVAARFAVGFPIASGSDDLLDVLLLAAEFPDDDLLILLLDMAA
jgi:hypothetical protein